ncbi:MAG: hypothetical protein KatS3mg124_0722 [Porticoccaceae bacterium]|nr:MAG: hypothetical protein KatS3mg124_0722 [Porticoccaceae bacterium]
MGALKGPPLVEVAYHLGCALDPATRRAAGRALLAHYLTSLQAAGGPSLPLAEAERLCAAYLVFGFVVFLVNDPAFQAEAVNAACTARFAAAMVEENTPEILAAAAQLGRSGASDPW